MLKLRQYEKMSLFYFILFWLFKLFLKIIKLWLCQEDPENTRLRKPVHSGSIPGPFLFHSGSIPALFLDSGSIPRFRPESVGEWKVLPKMAPDVRKVAKQWAGTLGMLFLTLLTLVYNCHQSCPTVLDPIYLPRPPIRHPRQVNHPTCPPKGP